MKTTKYFSHDSWPLGLNDRAVIIWGNLYGRTKIETPCIDKVNE
jgi:hypothetical protein